MSINGIFEKFLTARHRRKTNLERYVPEKRPKVYNINIGLRLFIMSGLLTASIEPSEPEKEMLLWPKKGNSADPDWLKAQRRLQAALIRCHMDEMDTPTRERATRTLEWLESI